eukprot:UN06172
MEHWRQKYAKQLIQILICPELLKQQKILITDPMKNPMMNQHIMHRPMKRKREAP